jgi:hypothetical protein
MHDTMHDFQDGLKDIFHSIHESLANMKEAYTMEDIMDECHQ